MKRWYGKTLTCWLHQRCLLAAALLFVLILVGFFLLQSYLDRELHRADTVKLSVHQRNTADALATLSSQLIPYSGDPLQSRKTLDEIQAHLSALSDGHQKFQEDTLLHIEQGVAAIKALKTESYFFVLAALVLLLLEYLFIFRPTSKFIEKQFYETYAALKHVQNAEKVLEQNQKVLQLHTQVLEELNAVFANPQRSFHDQIVEILTRTKLYLDLELGIVSKIEADVYRIDYVSSNGPSQVKRGATFDLAKTFCSVTWETDSICYFTDPVATEWECHPCYREFGLNAYIAAPFQVRGVKYGTVNFSSTKRRESPFSALEISIMKHVTGLIAALLERSLVEREVIESRERLKIVLDNAPVLVAYVDRDLIYRLSNATHREWFNGESATVVGRSMVEVLDAESFESIRVHVDAALRGERRNFETKMSLHDNSSRWVQDFYIPEFDKSGESVIGFFIFAFDIEDRKQAELELKRSNEELEQFAYVASHDLKAPLRAIKNYANWIIEDSGSNLPSQSLEHLIRLSSRASKMQDLLNDLLEYSKAGTIRGEPSETSICSLIHDIIELIAPPSDLNFEVPSDDYPVRLVKAPLEIVLRNLTVNAVKYGYRPDGTIRFSISFHPRFLQIEVQDDGPGIPKEYHDKVFQLFQSIHRDEEKSGTGMGLALVRKIVETSGGSIVLDSDEGRGCRFCFSYPYESVESGPPPSLLMK
jgi:PAS domain S-box-containing protein